MRNFVKEGRMITVIAAENYSSGDGVVVGSIFGIASTNAEIGQSFEIAAEGVFALNKAVGALAQGTPVYWTVGSGTMLGTVAAAGTMKIGVAAEAALTGDPTVNVRLNATFG
jgi:predicted RecA/RadA family phage recombinase